MFGMDELGFRLNYAAAAGNSKFGCREICETRGKTHKSGFADFGAGLLGISPSDRARFNLGGRERPNALNAAAFSREEDLKIHRHYIFNLISLFFS